MNLGDWTLFGDRDGETYDAGDDKHRLNKQARDVFVAIQDGRWHTLGEIHGRTGHPEASISARLRDLRKERFGAHIIERQSLGGGLWAYRWAGRRDATQ